MPTKMASAPTKKTEGAPILRWTDHPTLRAAEEHLQRGREALAAAEAEAAALQAEVERAKGHLHEALVAASLGEVPAAEADAARGHLEDCERRLQVARETVEAHRGALAILERRRDEAAAQAREEIRQRLEAQRKAAAERLGAVLAQAAAINRDLLRVEDLMRQNNLSVFEPLAWSELLVLTESRVLRNKTLTFDYAVGTDRCLLGLWLERARRAGYAVPDVEPVPLAEAVPSRFGRP
jgi:DNA repair exonuclease SbcCD ATPase subunit